MKAKYSFFGFKKKSNRSEELAEKERAKQLKMGMRVEREHHLNDAKTKQIAEDHLKEDPKYYTKLMKAGL